MSELVLIEPKEKPKASEAFALYWALGPKRSLAKLADFYLEQGYSANRSSILRQFQQWSSDNRWQDRIKAIAAEQIEQAAEHRTSAYVKISGEYDRRVSDEAGLRSARISELHGIYDRVKPEMSQTGSDGSGSHITVNFAFVEVTRPD